MPAPTRSTLRPVAPLVPPEPSETSARVSFRQPVTPDGFVDAGWWPRTRDLTAELPALLEVLWTADRAVNRVSYNLAFWDAAPRRIVVEGRRVSLGGFNTQSERLVSLIETEGYERIDVLVIPPETEPRIAERALALASTTDSTDTATQMFQAASA
jgi:hypothetical protein